MLYPTREWRLVHVDIDAAEREAHEGHIVGLIKVNIVCNSLEKIILYFSNLVKIAFEHLHGPQYWNGILVRGKGAGLPAELQ